MDSTVNLRQKLKAAAAIDVRHVIESYDHLRSKVFKFPYNHAIGIPLGHIPWRSCQGCPEKSGDGLSGFYAATCDL